MTIQEAYEIFYGKTKIKISKEMIEKNYTDEIIKKDYRKLTLKYHPDIHNGEENYNEIMKQINLAKEILLSSCKPPKNNDNTPPKSVSQIINTSDNDLTEILPAFIKLAQYAYKLREYKIKTRLYKNTEYYYQEVKKCSSPLEIYKSIQEFDAINRQAKLELYTIKGLYNTLKQMIESKTHTPEYMVNALKNIAGDYYDSLDNPLLRLEVEDWEKKESESSERKYKDQLSYIKNIKNILSRILKNSTVLNNLICQTTLNRNATMTISTTNTENSLVSRFENFQKYRQLRRYYTERMTDWSDAVSKYLQEITDLKDRQINETYITKLDNDLRKIISEKDMPLLVDEQILSQTNDKEYRKSVKQYNINNSQLDKDYKELIKKIKKEIINIKNFILTNERKEPRFDIQNNDIDLVNLLTSCQKKAIALYYKIFICYYVNMNNSMIPDSIENIYSEMNSLIDNDKEDPKAIEYFYNVLTKKYNELNFKGFEYTSKTEKQTIKTIAYDIRELVSFMEDNNVKIPENIISLIERINELNLIEIYKLHESILDIIYPKVKNK